MLLSPFQSGGVVPIGSGGITAYLRRTRGAGGGASSLLTGLVSYWTLDEASGNRADSHGGNTLTDVNSVGQASGRVGSAASFAGTNQILKHVSNSDLQGGNFDMEVCGWVYFDSTSGFPTFVSKGLEWELFANHNITFRVNSAAKSVSKSISLSTGTWYFIDAYHDSVNDLIAVTVNDATFATASLAGGITAGSADFAIGDRAPGGVLPLSGRVDEVGIWHRLLTPTERTALYNAGSGTTYPF